MQEQGKSAARAYCEDTAGTSPAPTALFWSHLIANRYQTKFGAKAFETVGIRIVLSFEIRQGENLSTENTRSHTKGGQVYSYL
jgi:hypothetical protein